jgi:NAD(P)-dependent dehydrogenase (short-subunit alcohol dehydrogenase family)
MIAEKFSLAGKRGIVTGASRGLGRAMAEGLAEMGADLIVAARNRDRLEETADCLRAWGGKIVPVAFDAGIDRDIETLVGKTVAELGGIDFVFCNAGLIRRGPSESHPIGDFDEVFRINVHSVFLLAQLAARVMIGQGTGGSIVMTDSVVSQTGGRNIPAYAASKGAVRMLVKSMANDLGRFAIRVNAIGPGYFKTDMTRELQDNPERYNALLGRMALGRWGSPEDLAGIAVFLAGDASAYLTGQTIYVDGGFLSM